MTMRDAQMKAVEGLEKAFQNSNPRVYVKPFEGILSITVASNVFNETPVFLVSPIAADSEKVDLAIYFLATSSDRGLVDILDKGIEAIRDLPGEGRFPLEVSAKSVYDDNAFKKGLRIWAVMTAWPHLADGSGSNSPLSEPVSRAMQDILQLFPERIAITTSEAEARQWTLGHKLPFVTVTATKAEFDKSDARRVFGVREGKRWEAKAKGVARWVLTITAYAQTMADCEDLIWPAVPYIPSTSMDEYGFNTKLLVSGFEYGEVLGAVTLSAICTLEVPAFREPENIASIRNAEVFGKED